MLEAILDTARQLRRSRKLPQPRGGYRKPKNVSQRQQKGGGDGRLYSESISELASAKRLIDADAGSSDNIASTEMVDQLGLKPLLSKGLIQSPIESDQKGHEQWALC